LNEFMFFDNAQLTIKKLTFVKRVCAKSKKINNDTNGAYKNGTIEFMHGNQMHTEGRMWYHRS